MNRQNRGSQSVERRPRQEAAPSQNAHKNYEHYLVLARAKAAAGDPIGAENYYQHAEHYLRSSEKKPN